MIYLVSLLDLHLGKLWGSDQIWVRNALKLDGPNRFTVLLSTLRKNVFPCTDKSRLIPAKLRKWKISV